MAVTSIQRDTNNNVSLVRISTTDTMATVGSANYIAKQQANINALNGGIWAWFISDMVLVSAADGNAFYYFTNTNFATLTIYSGSSITLPLSLANGGTGVAINSIKWRHCLFQCFHISNIAGTPTANQLLLSGASSAPSWSSLSSAIDTLGSAQGDILYRNATGWIV